MTTTLYYAPQTCARVALTALEEIGKPFEARLIAFRAGEHRSPEYLAINPSGKVPALDTGQGVVTQNGAILSYLARTYPEAGLLPLGGSALEEATALSMLFRLSADLHPLVTRFVLPGMILGGEGPAQQIRDQAEKLLCEQLGPLEQMLEASSWLAGEDWSILDSYLAWVWFRITGQGFSKTAFPRIDEMCARANTRPSAIAAIEREQMAQSELERRGLAFTPPPIAGDGQE